MVDTEIDLRKEMCSASHNPFDVDFHFLDGTLWKLIPEIVSIREQSTYIEKKSA